ncbi:MAG: hypothetical protein L6406_15840 [Desulfobacterales bacterium]|nr:hypothetical protein [Desulfobacterales bacterium]
MSDNLDLFVELYNIIDEGQKARLVEKIRNRMDRVGAIMCNISDALHLIKNEGAKLEQITIDKYIVICHDI